MTDTNITSVRHGSASTPAAQSIIPTMDMDGSSRASRVPICNGTRQADYGLWRLRLRAELRTKGIWKYVNPNPSSSTSLSTSGSTGLADGVEMLEKASAIIISSIGDSPLRVIEDVDDDPKKMLKMLDERYAPNRATSRIAVQTQLYRKVYDGGCMATFVDEFKSLFSQLERMGKDAAIPETHKAPMLLASIPVDSPLEVTAAALRTKDIEDLTWEYVSATLIDEVKARSMRTGDASGSGQSNTNPSGRRKKKGGRKNGNVSNTMTDFDDMGEATKHLLQLGRPSLATARVVTALTKGSAASVTSRDILLRSATSTPRTHPTSSATKFFSAS